MKNMRMMKMKTYKFYDTCSLLLKANNLFESDEEQIVISSITLNELENIKTATNKDADVKYAARRLLHLLDEHPDDYIIHIFTMDMLKPIEEKALAITDDMRILATAIDFLNNVNNELIFITNDLALKHIAKSFFNTLKLDSVKEDYDDDYQGYKEINMTDEELVNFYSSPNYNYYNLKINEYIIINTSTKKAVDTLCWTGNGYRRLIYNSFNSKLFGEVKPFKGDIYQTLFVDSLVNNQITMVKGPAGSGKTFLSMAYLINQLERGKIDKIIVFCNTVATKNSAKLGYYPGTRDEKLLDSQIGNLLISKLGSRMLVEQMIEEEKLALLPLSDIRGYDTSGMKAGIYISEAQNMDIDLMKLTLQRIGEDSICIIDGDCKAQVDSIDFAGANNGMRRASKVFRGEDIYGEVTLQNIHRSRIAEIAEQL